MGIAVVQEERKRRRRRSTFLFLIREDVRIECESEIDPPLPPLVLRLAASP
jgi:hypothetical protein